MKSIKILILFTLAVLITACAQPARITKLKPAIEGQTVYKIEEGKLTQELGVRTAILKPKGEIKSSEIKKNSQSGNGIYGMGMLGFLMNKNTGKESLAVLKFNSDFENALHKSIESTLLQKGYNVVGAFDNWEALTYDDKKRIDFLVMPEFNIKESGIYEENLVTPKKGPYGIQLEKGKVGYNGILHMRGDLTITILEPMTREKLWVKNISFESNKESLEVEVEFDDVQQLNEAMTIANNAFYRTRESYFYLVSGDVYNKYIDLIKTYLPSGEEATNLAKQARQLKEIKRY